LCGVKYYASAQSLDFLATTKNYSFPSQKQSDTLLFPRYKQVQKGELLDAKILATVTHRPDICIGMLFLADKNAKYVDQKLSRAALY
jgi:hypothetical protein